MPGNVRKVVLRSPIRVALERKTKKDKVVALNINGYRNNHHSINNNVKRAYKEQMLPQVKEKFKGIKVGTPISIDYHLFVGTRRKLDVSNILAIVDKNFQDVLVEAGIIPDDNFDYVTKVVFNFGGYDKGNERAMVVVKFPEHPGDDHE